MYNSKSHDKYTLETGDNRFIEAHGTGQIILSTTRKGEQEQQIIIQDVHYVPELGESLLSISDLINHHNKVILSSSGCKTGPASERCFAPIMRRCR